ncbi:pleckstrin homology domain-containing family J member 1 isoform X2 [Petromyzon marinus]|uniref:Pleckstrin homology domain-containing family J member 1 n=1 Tax=Petromyzon marinus TaxID=7757 RepID=A0AAJ7TYU0_PETMA|nr:pleckstrin homology domain-containing family J member 1 isoform X2 [Petromyzon marinus]XP_032826600.1 pleckstrin homology domain-containing family J member 1 isoform X2 [Petromyzon marinus]
MRYNERELVSLAGQPCQRQARVQMRAWAAGKREGYKERNIKLVMNFLFYFRVDETEPVGALVLEECEVERNSLPNSNCFSLVYRGGTEQRYCFVCSSISECDEWMKLLARASYERMRRRAIGLREEIRQRTGKDPLEQYGISDESRFQLAQRKL